MRKWKYIKEFRVFRKPTLLSIPQDLTTEDNLFTYVNYIANEMNEELDDIIATGIAGGTAFTLKSGKVLKLTEDSYEAQIAEYLRKKDFRYVISYYDVRKIIGHPNQRDNNIYAIVMDKITPLTKILEQEMDFDLRLEIDLAWSHLQIEDYKTISIDFNKFPFRWIKSPVAKKFFQENWHRIRLILKDCHKMGFKSDPDFHIKNVGVTDDGRWVFFDLSRNTYKTKFDKPIIRKINVSNIIDDILMQQIR